MLAAARAANETGGARRRRLRQWLRHERLSVAMALPSTTTTQLQGDRRWPGPGKGGASRTTRPRSGRPPFTSQSSSSCLLTKSPAGRGLTASLASGRRSRYSGTTVEQVVDAVLGFPTLDVPAPQLAEQLVEVPTILYFLKQTVDIPVPRGRGRRL